MSNKSLLLLLLQNITVSINLKSTILKSTILLKYHLMIPTDQEIKVINQQKVTKIFSYQLYLMFFIFKVLM